MVLTNPKPTTFIATLGGQPKVVTFALDTFLSFEIPITEGLCSSFIAPQPANVTGTFSTDDNTVWEVKCRNAWELPEDGRLDYRFLADKFERYF